MKKTLTQAIMQVLEERYNMCNFRIYDNYEEEWKSINFADYDDAENYVTNELCDADFERYSIYELISGN